MKLRLPFIAMGVAGILAMSAGSTLAVIPGTLDSQQTGTGVSLLPEPLLAQTFVPTISGTLNAVEVYTSIYIPPSVVPALPPSVTVQITGTASDVPTPTILDAVTITPASGGWNAVLFSPGITVAAGTKYAILLNAGPSGTAEWNAACSDPYGPGAALISDAGTWKTIPTWNDQYCISDFAFRTYITAPPDVTPGPTPPPTSTSRGNSGDAPSDSGYLLVFAGMTAAASAAVLFSISRRRLTAR